MRSNFLLFLPKAGFILFLLFGLPGQVMGQQDKFILMSPDENYQFKLGITAKGDKTSLFYTLEYKDKPVILSSRLEMCLDNSLSERALAINQKPEGKWFDDLELESTETNSQDSSWEPVYGERSLIKDNYHEKIFTFYKVNSPHYKIVLKVRAYNEGVAFQFLFPEHPKGVYHHITEENNEFTFPEGTKAWFSPYAQAEHKLLPLKNWPGESERPLTLELENGLYVSLAEAAMVNYARTKFTVSDEKPNTVLTSIYSDVDLISPFSTPWRVIMVAEAPGKLLENNYIILNLNKPNQIENTSWIQPGKNMREITLTDANAKATIDFAAEHNLQYVLFDWKWYGPAMTFESDATTVEVDLDLQKWIDYASDKGIGIWLYVNQQALYKQAAEIFPLYKKWGVKGVKFGFVNVGSQFWSTWLHDAIKLAAENELMVNVHDEYRPTGFSRTYPNLMTSEGIRGNEEFPGATNNTVLPFTRQIAGAGDYTICYYDSRLNTTHAHQLALGVIFYSPLQTLFWYDKPSHYNGEPEIEFFEALPAAWDKTRVLNGEIGEYITIARKKGDDWFLGAITNNEERNLEIPLDFLSDGKSYKAHVYVDDPKVKTTTKVKVERVKNVNSKDKLKVSLLASGGYALWLEAVK